MTIFLSRKICRNISFRISLFQLEKKRSDGLQFIVVILQKVKSKVRRTTSRTDVLVHALVETTSSLSTGNCGHSNSTNFPKVSNARPAVTKLVDLYRNVANTPDLGKSIKWPAPKPGFVPMNNLLKKIYQRFEFSLSP